MVLVVVIGSVVFATVKYILTHFFDCDVLFVFCSNSDSGTKRSQYQIVAAVVVVVWCGVVVARIRCIDCVILRVYVTCCGGDAGG